MQTAPSVEPGVARALVVDLPELGALGRRQITSLVGLAPFAKDIGKKSGYRRIRAGRAAPRTALYLAAMNGGSSRLFLGQVVYIQQGTAGNVPLAAAFCVVPIVIMGAYPAAARRFGALDAL